MLPCLRSTATRRTRSSFKLVSAVIPQFLLHIRLDCGLCKGSSLSVFVLSESLLITQFAQLLGTMQAKQYTLVALSTLFASFGEVLQLSQFTIDAR